MGTLLLTRLEEQLFGEHDTLELESFRDNDHANSFYRKHGWKATGAYREEQYGVDMVVMQKQASRATPAARS